MTRELQKRPQNGSSLCELTLSFLQKLSKDVLASQQPVENTLRQGRRFLEGNTSLLPTSARTELDTKMVSLEIRWMRLQRESDNRYRRLVVIHEKLSTFEEVLHPFVVSTTFHHSTGYHF